MYTKHKVRVIEKNIRKKLGQKHLSKQQTKIIKCPTYEWSSDCSGGQFIRQVDSEHRVAQQYADLKGDACTAVQRQVEADHVHQHEEDAGDEETHHIQQGAPADQHLNDG